jgi:hypothetical protein
MNRHFIACVSLALVSSCYQPSDGLERLEELYPTPQPKPVDTSCGEANLGEQMCLGLGGNWAVRLVQPATISPLGQPWDLKLYDLFLGKLSSDGSQMELRFCNQDVSIFADGAPLTLGQPKSPQALKDALYATPFTVPVTGSKLSDTQQAWLWGVQNLANPLTDALPTKQDYMSSNTEFDQDNDSHPGVTVDVVSPPGQRYMVRRAKLGFGEGKLSIDNKWLTGKLSSSVEEIALGATNAQLETAAPLTLKDDQVRYEFLCVGATYTCASLISDHQCRFKSAPR